MYNMTSAIPNTGSIDDKARDPKWKNAGKAVLKYGVVPAAVGTATYFGYDDAKELALDFVQRYDHVGGYVVATADRILESYKPHASIGAGALTAGVTKLVDMYRNRKKK